MLCMSMKSIIFAMRFVCKKQINNLFNYDYYIGYGWGDNAA